jgi:hypothetical protein
MTDSTAPIPGAEFDAYATPPREGDWSYVLDDTQIVYGKKPWPFRRRAADGFAAYGSPGRRQRARYTEGASIRLSPDVEFRSWRNEYVVIHTMDEGSRATGNLRLWAGQQGMGGWVYNARFDVAVPSFDCSFRNELPGELEEQGRVKLDRITAFLRAEAARRDSGKRAPVTAADLESKREKEQVVG